MLKGHTNQVNFVLKNYHRFQQNFFCIQIYFWSIPFSLNCKRLKFLNFVYFNRRVNVYESDKAFYNRLWFCILKSLQNVLKSPQITPEVPKSMHLGHIFLLGNAKTVFLHCPPHLPKPREPPHTSNGLSVAAFCFKSEKKHISGHN